MREIKFKIWADNKFYDKCLVGNTNNSEDDKWTCPLVWLEDRNEWVHCDNGIICQYTGLKDKNGKEIYEGDIVAEHGHYYNSDKIVYQKIQWKENYSCWLKGEYERLTPKNVEKYKIEVVGNIYENSELLKE